MRSLSNQIRRLTALIITLGFFVYIGHQIVTQMLFADVYQLNGAGLNIDNSQGNITEPGLTNRFEVNGNRYTERLFELPMSVSRAQEWVRQMYSNQESVQYGRPERPEIDVDKVYEEISIPVEFEGSGWASISRFEVDKSQLDGVTNPMKLPLKGTHVSIRAQGANRSQVRVVQLDPGFQAEDWLNPGKNDVSGEDLAWMPRYPGSRRAMSLKLAGDSGDVQILAYDGIGAPREHAAHYLKHLKQENLKVISDRSLEEGVRMIEMKGKSKEISMFSSRKVDAANISSVLIQIRNYN